MSPPTQTLTSGIRGYVCRSCLLKIQKPSRRTPWLCRGIASDGQPPKSNTQPKPKPKPNSASNEDDRLSLFEEQNNVRWFEEAPDGTRKEVLLDDDAETLKETLSSFGNLENKSGMSPQAMMDALGGAKDILDAPEYMEHALKNNMGFGAGALTALELQNEQLRLQIQKLKSKSNSEDRSPGDLLALFQPITTNAAASPQSDLQSNLIPYSQTPKRQSVLDDISFTSVPKKIPVPKIRERTPSQEESESIPIEKFPHVYQAKIQTLQEALAVASSPPRLRRSGKSKFREHSPIHTLWKDYLLCRPGLLSVPRAVPFTFWARLWKVFDSNVTQNLDRIVHLKTLGDDMLKSGVRMTPPQRFLYIECTFIHGDQVDAIRDWKAAATTRWTDSNQSNEYQELGVRMFCLTHQISPALEAAEKILQNSKDLADYRILIPIITACLSAKDGPDVRRAWGLYERLRLNLGNAIKMEDFDAVTSLFFDANQPDLALRIFTDMMLLGSSTIRISAPSDPDAMVTRNQSAEAQLEKPRLNWKDSRALAKLPAQFNNPFFFGSWTKKLIGAGELASVKKVFDLMQDRGIRPSSIHMNGLIGAWLRDGTEKSRAFAEELAWKMIRSRVDFVRERDHIPKQNPLIRAVYSSGKPDNKSLLVPLATMETFTILIQQYRRGRKYELFGDLFDALQAARLPVDTVFMNELLWIDTKGHRKGWVWKTYQSLMETRAASPDFTTYAVLWQCMKKQEDPVIGGKNQTRDNFTTCRQLFADMIKRTETLRTKKELPLAVYDLIMQCFSYSQDLPATAVALRALHRHFNVLPNVQTARTIVIQLARIGMVSDTGSRRVPSSTNQERMVAVTQVLELLKQKRIEILKEQGIIYEELDQGGKDEESLILLLDLLKYAYDARQGPSQPNAVDVGKDAAMDMGVPDCEPWDTGDISM